MKKTTIWLRVFHATMMQIISIKETILINSKDQKHFIGINKLPNWNWASHGRRKRKQTWAQGSALIFFHFTLNASHNRTNQMSICILFAVMTTKMKKIYIFLSAFVNHLSTKPSQTRLAFEYSQSCKHFHFNHNYIDIFNIASLLFNRNIL